MKYSDHLNIAFAWVVCSSVIFKPLLYLSKLPDVGTRLSHGIAFITFVILAVPLLLKWPLFRRCFLWTDALSDRQRQALTRRDLRGFYLTAFKDGYASRVKPYCVRISFGMFFLLISVEILELFMPEQIFGIHFGAVGCFIGWYPLGVLSLVFVSLLPLGRLFCTFDAS